MTENDREFEIGFTYSDRSAQADYLVSVLKACDRIVLWKKNPIWHL